MMARLRQEVKRSGRTLKDVAVSAGVGYAVVWRLVNGGRETMTLSCAERIAETLGFSIELVQTKRAKSKGR